MQWTKSQKLFQRAQKAIPGGVNSPVRAFKAVGGTPLFIRQGSGAKIYDADGNEFIDYVMSWGALISGHSHPGVVQEIEKALKKGTSFGAPTENEIVLTELIQANYPSAERVRLTCSGTEAAMTAIRLARAATGRALILKFDGCYHGHSDSLLVKAGSGIATGGIAGSPGVPESVVGKTISIPYNNLNKVKQVFRLRKGEIAGIIVEAVAANMGVVLPREGFLSGLREITQAEGAVLVFDEVITGFRIARGGASEVFNIKPDLVVLGKIIGGGMPIGAVGGRKEIMEMLAPVGNVYQAGTLSGNPVAVAAGIATLKELDNNRIYPELKAKAEELAHGLGEIFKKSGIHHSINWTTGLLTVFFGRDSVNDFETAQKCDMDKFALFHRGMLEGGIYLPPSGYEAWFLSTAHQETEIEATLSTAERVIGMIT